MLFLNREDIFEAVELEEVVDVVEESMLIYESGEYEMPTRMHVDYDGNTLLLMPCSAGKKVGTKLLTLTPDNEDKDIPMIQGCFIMNDAETGEMLTLIEGSSLTALRTGAVGSVGIRHLTPETITSIGIVGAGVQGFHQALFASEIRDIEDIYVYDINSKRTSVFVDKFKDEDHLKIRPVDHVKELITNSEVVITTTTANEPVLPDERRLFEGKHFVGIGSYKPDMREYPKAIFDTADKMFIDTFDAMEESGDLLVPLREGWIEEEQIYTIGKLLSGETDADINKTTFFKSVGMALFDLAAAKLVYEKAEEKGMGTHIEM